jgi:hypothetical protein
MNNQNQRKLDEIKARIARQSETSKHIKLIDVPYRGSRYDSICYHPLKNPNIVTAYDEAKASFLVQLHGWYDTAGMYQSEQTLSEIVIHPQLKKDLVKILYEIDKERDPYLLEALGTVLWVDKEGAAQNEDGSFDHKSEKVQQHDLDFMAQLKVLAQEIKFKDLGVVLNRTMNPAELIQHTYTG